MSPAPAGLAPPPVGRPAADIWHSLPWPLLLLDAQGHVRSANPAAEALLNASRQGLEGRRADQLLAPDSAVVALIRQARRDGGDLTAYDLDISLADGRTIHADLLVGHVEGCAGWLTLGFHRRAVPAVAARHLDQQGASRAITGAAAMLAHEIRNPLAGIRGAAQLLAGSAGPGGPPLTDLIIREVDRIRALIDRMEGFGSDSPPRRTTENIHAILGHVRQLAEAGTSKNVTFTEQYDPSLPPLSCDRDALVQLFLNLVHNAIHASPTGGVISITTAFRHGLRLRSPHGGAPVSLPLEICIIDAGEGPPADIVSHMFEPFVSGRDGGSGLGLALVAKVTDEHGGLVEYARRDGRTLFRILLPLSAGQP